MHLRHDKDIIKYQITEALEKRKQDNITNSVVYVQKELHSKLNSRSGDGLNLDSNMNTLYLKLEPDNEAK